jgi:5-formyltetrahydrofolate cyclo-ligase
MKQQIRLSLRKKRRLLSPPRQEYAKRGLVNVLRKYPPYRFAKRIAFYVASDGEIDPGYLIRQAMDDGKKCYLPVIHPLKHNRLYFVEHLPTRPLVTNHLGIKEPKLSSDTTAPCWILDIIFLPLVAFDHNGWRLGMGGGYYDRTLSYIRHSDGHPGKPLLIGLAHSFQEVENLRPAAWDVPMHAIATENKLIIANPYAIKN